MKQSTLGRFVTAPNRNQDWKRIYVSQLFRHSSGEVVNLVKVEDGPEEYEGDKYNCITIPIKVVYVPCHVDYHDNRKNMGGYTGAVTYSPNLEKLGQVVEQLADEFPHLEIHWDVTWFRNINDLPFKGEQHG